MNHDLTNAKAQVEERWREFWEDHKNFDPPWVRGVLFKVGDFLNFIFALEGLEKGFRALYEGSDVELPPNFDWTSAGEVLPTSSLEKLPLYRIYLALRAYAYYGLKLDDTDDPGPTWDLFLEQYVDLRSFFPQEWLRDDEEADRTIKAASARMKLEHTEWEGGRGLTASELAALAGVSRKSIMNLLSPKGGGPFRIRPDGTIHVESAKLWLSGRTDFRSSIWHLQEGMQLRRPDREVLIDGEPEFVPVADDIWFSPEHAIDGRFHVAKGGQWEVFEDYWRALKFLSHAASPRWRYRDEIGRWQEKAARGWERKLRQEIEKLIGQMEEQVKANRQRKKP